MRAFLRAATVTIAWATTALLTTPGYSQQQQYDGVDGFGHGIKAKPE
jgi:hypothetical protein